MLEDHQAHQAERRSFSDAGLILVLVIAAAVAIDFWQSRTFSTNIVLTAAITIFPILISASRLLPALKINKQPLIFIMLYHAAAALLLILVVPILSPYLMIWIMLASISMHYFDIQGLVTSHMLLAGTILVGMWYQNPQPNQDSIMIALVWYILLSAISFMLNRMVHGNHKLNKDTAKRVLHAEYEHERMVNLINSMSEAVIAVDEMGEINIYNAAALDLLDTNLEISGKNIAEVIKLYDSSGQKVEPMQLAADTRYLAHRSDLQMKFSAEDTIALDISVGRTSLHSGLDEKAGYTFILRDITEQKSLDEQKDIFISQVSHELRTPITVAEANVSMAQLLLDKPDTKPTKLKDALEKAHRQVMFLAEMVNDLSTLSRAERQDKSMELETFDIYSLLTDMHRQFLPQATEKKLTFKVIADRNLPKITTSRLYLSEILQNLIINAIKYTPTGRVTVQAKLIESGMIGFFVADTGIGIAKSDQKKVFEKFWRSEDPLTRQTNGTGLGLYITHQLARRIGATISCESELKKGSVFSVILPAQSSAHNKHAAEQ